MFVCSRDYMIAVGLPGFDDCDDQKLNCLDWESEKITCRDDEDVAACTNLYNLCTAGKLPRQ
jgi:hypothetical protein